MKIQIMKKSENLKALCRQNSRGKISMLGNGFKRSERGMAMLSVLILSGVSLLVAATLMYVVTSSTWVSGRQKAFATAREASKGCAAVFMQLIETRAALDQLNAFAGSVATLNYQPWTPATCQGGAAAPFQNGIEAKIMTNSRTWVNCNTDINITPENTATYDMSATIGTGAPIAANSGYNCYGKIVSTADGNSGNSLGLRTKGVVSNGGEVQPVSIPYFYAIEVLTVKVNNPAERSKLSVLFQY